MNKFKQGDKVRIISDIYCDKGYEGIVSDIEFDCDSCDWYISLKNSNISLFQDNFELVSTSEQLAVDKFKEELKEKILKRIKETDKGSEYGWSCISKDDILELLK